jgi:hypothetical protein
MQACRVVRYRGSRISWTFGSQMAVSLSALRAGRTLPPEIYSNNHLFLDGRGHCATGRKVPVSRPDDTNEYFSVCPILAAALGTGLYSASRRN